MTPPVELDLVKQAILLGQTVTGCCEWHERAFQRVKKDSDLLGLTPAAIRRFTIEFVAAGGTIQQIKEQRPEYNDFDYYYKAVLVVSGFPHGLFVELRMVDPDVDCPTVLLVNAHPQRK